MTFLTEAASIEYFCKWLEKKGFKNIQSTQSNDIHCPYDVEAVFNSTRYLFECKRRNKKSTDFNDSVIELTKFVNILSLVTEGKAERAVAASFFEDKMVIVNILNTPHTCVQKYCEHTTDFADKRVVLKTFCVFQTNDSMRFEYDYDILKTIDKNKWNE